MIVLSHFCFFFLNLQGTVDTLSIIEGQENRKAESREGLLNCTPPQEMAALTVPGVWPAGLLSFFYSCVVSQAMGSPTFSFISGPIPRG